MSAAKKLRVSVGSRALALLVLSSVFIAYAIYLGGGDMVDDAAISLAYAKNLVHGHGLALTPGAARVEGYSNFLWVLVMTPAFILRLDPVWSAKLTGLGLSVATLILVAQIPGMATGRRGGWLDLLAPALTAASLPFAIWAVSGMENGLESFLLVLAVVLTYREVRDSRALPWSAAALFGLAITRPEGVVFAAAAVAYRALLFLQGRRAVRQDILWAMALLAPLLLYHAWHYAYFGELVPNTYFAKAHDRTLAGAFGYATDPSDPGFHYLRSVFADYRLFLCLPLIPLALAGRENLKRYSLVLLLVLAGLVAVLFNGGDWMNDYRFVTPLLPLFFLLVQEGLRSLIGVARSRSLAGRALAAAALLPAIAALAFVGIVPNVTRAGDAHSKPYLASYFLIRQFARPLEDVSNQFGISEPSLLTPDIGAPALAGKFSIVDLGGLADRYIAKHGYGSDVNNYIFVDRKPDLMWLHEPWFTGSGIAGDPRFASDYVQWNARYSGSAIDDMLYVRKDIFIPSPTCAEAIPWQDAGRFVDKLVTVTGTFAAVRLGPTVGDRVIGIAGAQEFAVVSRGEAANRLPELRPGSTVCARGIVRNYGGPLLMISEVGGSISTPR